MQQVVAQLGRRFFTMATLNNNSNNAAMDSLRQQKKALRTIVRRELRNFSPETKRQEGEQHPSNRLQSALPAIDLSRLECGVRVWWKP